MELNLTVLGWIRVTFYGLPALVGMLVLAFGGFLLWHLRQPVEPRE
jgi:hypothetical protein